MIACMARIADHPIRVARLKAGLSQNKLATLAGIHRSALTAIEDGRTQNPTDKLIDLLASHLGTSGTLLRQEITEWLDKPLQSSLRPSAQNLMLIPPYTLGQYYKTFQQWRSEIAPTQTAFASLLRINPAIVRDFENGTYKSMPDSLAGKMLKTFEPYGFGSDYLVALENLARG